MTFDILCHPPKFQLLLDTCQPSPSARQGWNPTEEQGHRWVLWPERAQGVLRVPALRGQDLIQALAELAGGGTGGFWLQGSDRKHRQVSAFQRRCLPQLPGAASCALQPLSLPAEFSVSGFATSFPPCTKHLPLFWLRRGFLLRKVTSAPSSHCWLPISAAAETFPYSSI